MTAKESLAKFEELISAAQMVLGNIDADGDFGPLSQSREKELRIAAKNDANSEWPVVIANPFRRVLASSFADPSDVKAFQRCKANGNSDTYCFGKGDNGIGCWGDDTTGNTAMVALPPEDMIDRWGSVDEAKHRTVIVNVKGQEVRCVLADRMRHRYNIPDGQAQLDMNPAACKAFNLNPPILVTADWCWG